MPDISIIIPTYNRLWCLPDAVDSCRRSQCEVEIIVVDDGSTDGTWDWLATQADVRAFRQENSGKDWAVNLGFSQAGGEFVRFLDSDDLLPRGANDRQLAAGRAAQADVVVAGHQVCNQDLQPISDIPWTECDDFIAQQLGECDSSHYSAYLFRRSFIDDVPHRQEFGVRDDRMFVIEVALKKPRVTSVSGPCLIHRHHANDRLQFQTGLASQVINWQQLQIYRKTARRLENTAEFTPRRRKAAAKALWPLAHWIAYSHLGDACRLAEWVGELDPAFVVPDSGALGWLYRRLGFRLTEQLLFARRTALRMFGS